MATRPFPGGKRFAFTVIDDTDVATVENVAPVYDLLTSLGMRTTKTVWPLACPEGSKNFQCSETLEDQAYRQFSLELQRRGFELTWHGATMESSTRNRTATALATFRSVFGHYPRVHANHAQNRENIYWGCDRFDSPLLKLLLRHLSPDRANVYEGHVNGTKFWWGDLCSQYVKYARNLTFSEINLLRVNPTLPYRDPNRPLVRWWFSASDAEDCTAFNRLISPRSQERLERERGVCIVATHFGKGFAPGGKLDPTFKKRMEMLSQRDGWFPTVGELLDWLSEGRRDPVPGEEWRKMQWRWARDLALRKAEHALRGVFALGRS